MPTIFAVSVSVDSDTLSIELIDGRSIQIPLEWYPRLYEGTIEERAHFRLVGQGEVIHWPALDEDVSVGDLSAGSSSQESLTSLKKWKEARSSESRINIDR